MTSGGSRPKRRSDDRRIWSAQNGNLMPLDVIAVVKWEGYGLGQSSTWYFAR